MARPPLEIPSPPDPRALLAVHGLDAKKSWGQNFLLDQDVLAAIADLAEAGPETPVLELGCGLGALTYHLLARGGLVLGVERDRELVPILRAALYWGTKLEILEADAGTLDYAQLAERLHGPLVVTGNLPYQLSSRILVNLAGAALHVRRSVLLLQTEVAERLCAEPGSRTYGLLSVLVQRSFKARLARRVPASAFLPRPKVESSVVLLERVANLVPPELDAPLVATAKAAFSARRKTLRNALGNGLGGKGEALDAAIAEAGVDPKARAETLGLAEFVRLAQALGSHGLLRGKPGSPEEERPSEDD